MHTRRLLGTSRLFADHKFYTPSQKAVFNIPAQIENTSDKPTKEYPLILTTGRVRDQWHTMTKTGKVSRLRTHYPHPVLEINPIDAAMIQYAKEKFELDVAVAYNQQDQKNLGTDYTITGGFSYKTMQLAHLTKSWDKASFSFLFMNNGFQKYTNDPAPQTDGVYNRQTTGTYFTFPAAFLKVSGSTYLQTGKASASSDLTAYQYMIELKYNSDKVTYVIGFESLI